MITCTSRRRKKWNTIVWDKITDKKIYTNMWLKIIVQCISDIPLDKTVTFPVSYPCRLFVFVLYRSRVSYLLVWSLIMWVYTLMRSLPWLCVSIFWLTYGHLCIWPFVPSLSCTGRRHMLHRWITILAGHVYLVWVTCEELNRRMIVHVQDYHI